MGLKGMLLGGTVLGAVAVFAGTGGFDDDTVRDEVSGEIVEGGGLGAFVVRVGDCIQWPGEDDVDSVESVEAVPCADPHDAEAYATFDLDLAAFAEDDVAASAFDGCLERWGPAIGATYKDDPDLDVATLEPSKGSWAAEDREVVCFVVSVDGDPRVGSDRL